jgi:hypothetical protein
MFRHVVLFELADETTAEQRRAIVDGLSELPAKIPELRGYHVGLDAGLADGNFDVGEVAEFDDPDGYQVYATHPDHLQVIAERIRPVLVRRVAVQFDGD